MDFLSKFFSTKTAEYLRGFWFYKRLKRLKWCYLKSGRSMKYLRPNCLWVNIVDVVVTTKCNLLCEGCSHLMPYYEKPTHMDRDRVIASMRKLNEAVDFIRHYNFLGGEPFLNPDLKYFLEEVPVEKCGLVQILTNATLLPEDPELFDVMRRKRVHVVMSQYPSNQETQKRLIAVLEREGVAWHRYSPEWTDYGVPRDYHRSRSEWKQQFNRCTENCNNLLDGKLYYCHRCAHAADLGFCSGGASEAVDLLNNTAKQNRRQIRHLEWRRKPLEACQYCLKGTPENVSIPRGK